MFSYHISGLPWWLSGKESTCQCRRCWFDLWVRKIPWRRKWQPTPVFLPGRPHGHRSLAGYSPWGQKESDTATKQQGCFGPRPQALYVHLLVPPSTCRSIFFLQNPHPSAQASLLYEDPRPPLLASTISLLHHWLKQALLSEVFSDNSRQCFSFHTILFMSWF